MNPQVEAKQDVKELSNQELGAIVESCQKAIADGSARVEEFESFVLCQRELAQRTWH